MVETIILFHNSKWYTPVWVLFFVLSIILLWINKKQWSKGYDSFFWFVVISVVIVYCPLLAHILVPRFLPSFAEYERLSWVFFEIPVISYVLIMLTKSISLPKNRRLFIAAFLAVFIFIGSPDNRSYFQKPSNKYRISQDAVTICDKIDSLSPSGPIVLCVQLETGRHFKNGSGLDGMLYYGIRTYESRFRLRYKDIAPIRYEQEDFKLADELPEDIDYYLCPKVDKVYRELERLGYSYIDESDNFAIFRNKAKD